MDTMPCGRGVGLQRAFLQYLAQVKEKTEVMKKEEEGSAADVKGNRQCQKRAKGSWVYCWQEKFPLVSSSMKD